MNKSKIKRSLSALLALFLLITACGVSGVSASTWVSDLGVKSSSTAKQAVINSWSNEDFATMDGSFSGSQKMDNMVTGGKLTNLDYMIEDTEMVGVRMYSKTDETINVSSVVGCVPQTRIDNPGIKAGDTIRVFCDVWMENISGSCTAFQSGVSRGMQIPVYYKTSSGWGTEITRTDNGQGNGGTTTWTGYNYPTGTFNADNVNKIYSTNLDYGYSYKTLYSFDCDITAEEVTSQYLWRMFPDGSWNYYQNPCNIYRIGIQKKNSSGNYETIYELKNQGLQALLDGRSSTSPLLCEPIKAKKVDRTTVGGKVGAYEVAGRAITDNGTFTQTRRYFLYDDFALYQNQTEANNRKVTNLCSNLKVNDKLEVRFTLALKSGFDKSVFDSKSLEMHLRARVNANNNYNMATIHLKKAHFDGSTYNTVQSATGTVTNGQTQTDFSYKIQVTKGSASINGSTMETYQITISDLTVVQAALDKLKENPSTSKEGGLNVILGSVDGYDYHANPLILTSWYLKNTTQSITYVQRSGAAVAHSSWGGCGPHMEFAYTSTTPTYKPVLMTDCYIPKGRVFTGFDEGANAGCYLPHSGNYKMSFTVQGEPGYAYTVAVIRKTQGKGVLTEEYLNFVATGEKQTITVPFYAADINDQYTFQINGGALWPNTDNNRGDEKLLVYGVQLTTDAVAVLGGEDTPLIGTELNKGTGGYSTMNAVTVPNVTLTGGQKIRLTQKMYCPQGIFSTGPYFRIYGNNSKKVVDQAIGKATYDNAATLTDATYGYSYKEISYDVTVGETMTGTMFHWFFLTEGAEYSLYPVRFYGLTVTDVTTGEQLYEVTGEQIAKAGLNATSVAQRGVEKFDLYGGITYPDLNWALEVAKWNDKITLLTDVDVSQKPVLSVPAGVTLDLAGFDLTARNLVSFGQMVDGTVGGQGSLSLVDRNGQVAANAMADLQTDNEFMPLYDSANGCYRFYQYQVVNAGCKLVATNQIKFGYKLRFYDASAFDLLARGDSGLTMVADVDWDGCGFEYRHAISAATLKSYAQNVKNKLQQGQAMDSIGTAVSLTVTKIHHIGAGNSIYSTPIVFSTLTGVSGAGTESSYAYNG